jgi:hypothetical protein
MDEFFDQLHPCDLLIRPSFGLLAFSQNEVSWHLLYFSKCFIFLKLGAKTHFRTCGLPKLSVCETTGK